MKKLVLLILSSIVLNACLGRNYKSPTMDLPNTVLLTDAQTTNSSESQEIASWWSVFADDSLNKLEEEALSYNQDLKSAMARVQEAKANLAIARSSYFPTINLQGTYGDSKLYRNLRKDYGFYMDRYSFGVSASYEFDLWGKYWRKSESAKSQWLASKEDKASVELTLTSSVAQGYFQYMALNAQLEIAKQTLKSREASYEVYSNRFAKGVINEFDLRRVEAEMESVRSQMYGVEQSLRQTETSLSVLLGRSPKQIVENILENGLDMNKDPFMPEVPLEIPTDLISRRPDVQSMEYSLKATNANMGEAKALLFPSLSINGSLSYGDYKFKDVFNKDNDNWSYSADLVWPIFAGGKNYKNYKAKKAQYAQMLANYQKTVQVAYKEVLDAINNYNLGKNILAATEKETAALERSYYLAIKREKAGLTDLLDVLDVERTLLQAQMALVQAKNDQLNHVVNACKAMGGRW